MKKLTKKKREKIATIIGKLTIVIMTIFAASFFICLIVFKINGIIDEKPYELLLFRLFNGAVFSMIMLFLEMHFIGKFINIPVSKKYIKNVLLSEEKKRERKYGRVIRTEEYDNYKYEIREKHSKYKAIILKKIWYDKYQTYDSYNKNYDEAWVEYDSSLKSTYNLDNAINNVEKYIRVDEKN